MNSDIGRWSSRLRDLLRRRSRQSSLELRFNWCTNTPMGNLRVCFVVALATTACGGGSAKSPDAAVKLIDAEPGDSKGFMDAPPPMFDFSCMGNTAPTTATATITVMGTVEEASINGITPK